MWNLIYQAVYRFFTLGLSPLNKGEVDQPPPPEVEIHHLEILMKAAREREARLAERDRRMREMTNGGEGDNARGAESLPEGSRKEGEAEAQE